MIKTIRGKVFINTLLLVIFSFVIIYMVQNLLVNEFFIRYRLNLIEDHMIRSIHYIESTDEITISNPLKNELTKVEAYDRTHVQIYSKNWNGMMDWFNPQLLSPYYIEVKGGFYRLLVDKYTNMVYQKDLIYSEMDNDLLRINIINNQLNGLTFKKTWQFDYSEIVYLTLNGEDSISLKTRYRDKYKLDDPIKSNLLNINEIQGVLLSQHFDDSIDIGYSYITKFMNEKTQAFIFNEKGFPVGETTILKEIDPYTGVPYNMIVYPFIVENDVYYLLYLSFYDDIRFLTPFEQRDTIIIFLALLLSGTISYVYAIKITKPILKIRNTTSALAKLDFSTQCVVDSEDEIKDLADDINKMAHQLQVKTDLLNKELMKMRQVEEFRKSFITISSHEFRTPLTIMRGILEGYEDGIYHKDDLAPLKVITFEVEQLENIVQEIITIGKTEAKVITYNKKHLQLMDIVQQNLNRYKYIMLKQNLSLSKHFDEGIIFGDEEKLSLVIKNVISNAIKYSNSFTTIYVNIIEDKDKMIFTVENEGNHIDEKTIQVLWEPFYRGANEKENSPGYGIGLYTTKLILTAHDAEYYLENTEDGVQFKAIFKRFTVDNIM